MNNFRHQMVPEQRAPFKIPESVTQERDCVRQEERNFIDNRHKVGDCTSLSCETRNTLSTFTVFMKATPPKGIGSLLQEIEQCPQDDLFFFSNI